MQKQLARRDAGRYLGFDIIMNSFDQLIPPPDTLPLVTSTYLAQLAEQRGRQEIYFRQPPERLDLLRKGAVIESAVSSNRIEGVEIDRSRVEAVVLGDARLKDRPEEEVRGYRDALEWIHREGRNLPITEETILSLHKMIRGDIADAGRYKDKTEPIIERYPDCRWRVRFTPTEADKTPAALRELVERWNDFLKEDPALHPIALGAFNLDFLCIHPFRDGNGRVSRLLLLLQSYHLGFEVGRYISLERLIEENKDRYYETLEQCSQGWHEGKHRPWAYVNYVLYILKQAYKALEERARH